ncbi:XkdW family protein [Bacillus sp. UNC438CL73TsuS30]|uniref:XkdW family protein n=1 Tax=Bacillus sp. UNC438CL73TsuS30 TaxID=1340434 RepID=UPI00047B3E57|nr:XkdW family protein [Bacillus sp. UNC438CL73TsuS30]
MKQSILKRYPELTEEDVILRDDGQGIYLDIWKSDKPKPTMDQVKLWAAEDEQLPKPKTELELMQQALDELILGGSGL